MHEKHFHLLLQGKAVCLVLSQFGAAKDKLSPCLLDHVMDIDGLHATYPGKLTIITLSGGAAAELHALMQWIERAS